ncbi:histone deacetylase 3 [Patellaria atrata CBS 101060]|uniref:Histone deacetylase n=1 Tax=Patellaria atrata CBS 101060 TaxID=1346257 RepID=A0A9P4VPK6_9PEZI|nr:histone deacetylase 3 [Patellaria atrata CBS 101060]
MEPFSRSQIVQEWISPTPEPQMDYGDFKGLSEGQKEEILRKEAENNCIERPQGYNVSFHYNSKVEQHHFGKTHPMKPWRLQLTKQLVLGYGLEYAMDMYQTRPATKQEIAIFHDRGYLDFLELVTPNNVDEYRDEQNKYNFGIEFYDCPVFDGMWDYISLYSGATMDAARKVCSGQSNIAINWSGGLHHAKKSSASGFCYVNDIVLAIQYMMQYYSRILYIDIDVHHGDGVEQAFHSTNRVMTLSYHKYAPNEFFPGTGGLDETGPKDTYNEGAHHSLNVPLKDGIDDHEYKELFKVVTGHVIEAYKPQAIVIQCGADSLGGDRLGRFNLNITAHGYCVEFVKATHLPLLIIGGGGYTPRNVARTWTHETALCVGAQLHDDLPWHIPYRRAFSGERNGDGKLYPDLSTVSLKQNQNTAEELHTIVKNVHWEMRYVHSAPHVQMDRLPPAYDKIRDEIDREIREEQEEKDRDEAARKRRERNVGARGEMRMR